MQTNTTTVAASETVLIDQLPALLPDAVFGVNGTKMTTPQVVTQLKGHLSTIRKIEELRNELHRLVEQQQAERVAVRVTVAAVESYVVAYVGTGGGVYGVLGFVPRKHTAPSAEVSAAAVEKRLATRKKRHTMGKRQRAAIPPATLPAPVTTLPAPATSPPATAPTPDTPATAPADHRAVHARDA